MTYLVIDLGSSSVRTLLFTDSARLIDGAVCSRKYDFHTDSDGSAEADAASLQALTESCIDDILQHPAAALIRAVGMASFVGNWLGVDAQGKACTPVFTYADTRGRTRIPDLREKLLGDADSYHQATGCMLHPAYWPAQYAWLLATHSEMESRIHRLSDIGGFLYRQWFGREVPLSYSVASWSGLLDTLGMTWHEYYLRRMVGEALSKKLPALADFDALQYGLTDRYVMRWPQLRESPFFLAMGDGAVANIGSGAVDAEHIALTIGTTSALRVVKQIKRVPEGLWRYLVCQGMPLVGGATSEGGNVYQWVVEELGLDTKDLSARLAQRKPDQHGLTVLPLLAGERAPGWQPDASGTIHGIRRNSSKLDIMQAQLEAVAIRLSLIFDLLDSRKSTIMAGGGALQSSPAWAQMMADAFNRPIQLLAETEITARGVALMMRQRLDDTALNADPPQVSRVIHPNPRHVEVFREARARQVDLYQRLYG